MSVSCHKHINSSIHLPLGHHLVDPIPLFSKQNFIAKLDHLYQKMSITTYLLCKFPYPFKTPSSINNIYFFSMTKNR